MAIPTVKLSPRAVGDASVMPRCSELPFALDCDREPSQRSHAIVRGKVTYRLIGGPYDGEINVVPAMYCRDRLAISDTWIARGRDGGLRLMNGPMPLRAPWISFTRAVYEKVKPIMPGSVTFQFVRTENVDRCEMVLPDKGRRCRNEAEIGGKYCRVHLPSAQPR